MSLLRLSTTVTLLTALVLAAAPGPVQAAQNGACFNAAVGWLDLSGVTFSGPSRTFSGAATYHEGAYPGGQMAGTLNVSTVSGQQTGWTLGTVAVSNTYPVTGQGWSPQIGWVFASHSGLSPLGVIASGASAGQFTGALWSDVVGWFSCGVADVGAAAVHTITLPADTDNDGCTDAQEAIDNTNPANASSYLDSDGDGVPNCVETDQGTNPNDPGSSRDTDSDGVPDYREQRCTNAGDGNDDGISDVTQPSVACVANLVTGGTTTIVAHGGCSVVKAFAIVPESNLASQDTASDYPAGLSQFRLQCGTAGQSGQIDLLYDRSLPTTGWTFKKYNPTANTFQDITSLVSIGTYPVNSSTVTRVSYTVTDGDPLTDFNPASAVIDDPAGPAVVASSSSSSSSSTATGGGGGGGGGRITSPASSRSSASSQSSVAPGTQAVPLIDLSNVVLGQSAYRGRCLETTTVLSELAADAKQFTDVPLDAWYHDTVLRGVDTGMVSGLKSADGQLLHRFEPDRPVLLAEAIRMLLGVAGDLPSGIQGERWYVPLMKQARESGLLDALFVPADARYDLPLTRAQALPLFLMAACLDQIEVPVRPNTFPDVTTNTAGLGRILIAHRLGIVRGYQDGSYRPENTVSRAEMVALIFRTIDARQLLLDPSQRPYGPYLPE
jgi:S-layer homology domain/Bacterial TSP3 repeat